MEQDGDPVDTLETMKDIANKMGRRKGSPRTIFGLLRDLVTMVLTKAANRQQRQVALARFHAMLAGLKSGDMRVWDVSPGGDVSPKPKQDGNQPSNVLSISTAAKGLGLAGTVPIPVDMWQELRPPIGRKPTRRHQYNHMAPTASWTPWRPGWWKMVDGRAPHAQAFTKAKSQEKGSLIINMTTVNDRCTRLQHRLRLPTMESLAAYLRTAASAGRFTYFCKLNVSSMFWSCRLPRSEAGNVRFGVRGKVLGPICSRPCGQRRGWACVCTPPLRFSGSGAERHS